MCITKHILYAQGGIPKTSLAELTGLVIGNYTHMILVKDYVTNKSLSFQTVLGDRNKNGRTLTNSITFASGGWTLFRVIVSSRSLYTIQKYNFNYTVLGQQFVPLEWNGLVSCNSRLFYHLIKDYLYHKEIISTCNLIK